MKLFILTSIVVFSGCDFFKEAQFKPDQNHEEAKVRKCSKAQLESATAEFELCIRTGYFASHCYDIAIIKYCDKRIEGEK